MREVAVIGIGQTKVDEHWDKSLRELAGEAVLAALTNAGRERVDGLFVGNMLSGILDHQNNLGPLLADWVDLRGNVDAVKIEAACASGAAAFRAGLIAVGSGEMDTVVVVGVEKMTDQHPHEVTAALATASDSDWELEQGVSFVSLNALIMRRYMHEYGWQHADFAPFSINAHANAVHNPFAQFPNAITLDDYRKAHMVADPVNLLDASPIGDGAAAAVLIPADSVPSLNGAVLVVGSASATDTISLHDRPEALFLTAAYHSARRAYRQAGIRLNDIDVFELHDAFSIMSALSLEACGFAERGQGPRLALDDEIGPKGHIPISTRGGLKARGHPVGATGLYQIVEVVQQLRGECGATQVDGARIGMAQNIGGSGATVITHILKIA